MTVGIGGLYRVTPPFLCNKSERPVNGDLQHPVCEQGVCAFTYRGRYGSERQISKHCKKDIRIKMTWIRILSWEFRWRQFTFQDKWVERVPYYCSLGFTKVQQLRSWDWRLSCQLCLHGASWKVVSVLHGHPIFFSNSGVEIGKPHIWH